MDATMEKKLREIIDRNEIWQVLQRYGRGIDRYDRELVRSCYFDDAIDDHDTFVGNVEDFIKFAQESSEYFIAHHHGVMNHYCELAGDDAYCETYWLFTGTAPKPPHALAMGRYLDHFQRRNGEWRIANRVCVIEGMYELGDSRAMDELRAASGTGDRQTVTKDRNDVSYHRPPRPRKPPRR